MSGIQNDVKKAAAKCAFPIIYCMATHPEIIFNAGADQLMRVSNDFIPNDHFGSRKHIVNNFYNSSWLSKIFWPDFDMFQTNDKYAETFARMLAISGSPVYITDKLEQINRDLLRRIVLSSGEIPRYDNIAEILPSRFFDNPYAEGNVLAVSAKKNDAVTVGLFNVIESGHACSGQIRLKELASDDARYLIYSDKKQIMSRILQIEDSIPFFLRNMESDLISVVPIKKGFAVIGVVDFFAASALIECVEYRNQSCIIHLYEQGKILAFSEQQPMSVICEGTKLRRVESDLSSGTYSWKKGVMEIAAENKTVEIKV